MRSNRKKTEAPQFLSGWKDIANYLGKGVRTVQRYERDLGLPVRRPAGKPWGSVVATRNEIDAWVNASPIRDSYQLPALGPKYAVSPETIKAGLEEMRKLRDQMTALRAEVKMSVKTLGESVRALRGDISRRRRQEAVNVLEADLLRGGRFFGLAENPAQVRVTKQRLH
jgi:hypothetical protein